MLEHQIYDQICQAIAAAEPARADVYGLIRINHVFCVLPLCRIHNSTQIIFYLAGNEIDSGITAGRWNLLIAAVTKYIMTPKTFIERK